MAYSVEYFHSRVRDEIESWPVGILADYARLVELLMEFGPDLGMPHSRAMGGGSSSFVPEGAKASDARCTATSLGDVWSSCTRPSRTPKRLRNAI
jgi:hypothetical protein